MIEKAVKLTAEGQSARRRLDLHSRRRRRRLGHGDAGAGPARCAQRRPGRAAGHDRRGRAIHRALQHARRRHQLLAAQRRRAAAADFGRGRGHALQRRPIRRAGGQSLPGIRVAPFQGSARPGTRGAATTSTASSTPSQAFYLAGDKYWDDYFPARPRSVDRHAGQERRLVARATASARPTARRSP